MLNTFKTEWDKIGQACDTLKNKSGQIETGVATKENLPAALSTLQVNATAYVQAVTAFNSDAENPQLQSAVQSAMNTLEGQVKSVHAAIGAQIEANKKAPTGALQMPQTTPAAKYNAALDALNQQMSAVVQAMDLDLAKNGFGAAKSPPSPKPEEPTTPTDDAVEPTLGISLAADVKPLTCAQPDWFKADILKSFMAKP